MTANLTIDDIKAPIEVIFEQLAANVIKIGSKGTVLFFTKDEALAEGEVKTDTFRSALTIPTDFPSAIKQKIKDIFKGETSKVICVRANGTFEDALSVVKKQSFNYIFSDRPEAQADIVSYAKETETFAVVFNQKADSKWVINVTNPQVRLTNADENISMLDYLPRITGVLAGLPYTRSATSVIFDDLEDIEMPAKIEEGAFILNMEEDGVRVAAAVNSLTTLTTDVTEDMKSIAFVEAMKRIDTDKKATFKKEYKGRYKNHYSNQCLFIAALKAYYKELAQMGLLDPNYNNTVDVDIDTQRDAWLERGKTEAEQWSDKEVRNNTIGKMMYLVSDVHIIDAIEGLKSRVVLM